MASTCQTLSNPDPSIHPLQRRQSDLKSWGRETGSNKFRFFQANFRKISIFFRQFHKKFWFSRQKLAIHSYFWANYSISLQSHHFQTYFLYIIRCNNISGPVHDPCPKSGGSRPLNPQDWRSCRKQTRIVYATRQCVSHYSTESTVPSNRHWTAMKALNSLSQYLLLREKYNWEK